MENTKDLPKTPSNEWLKTSKAVKNNFLEILEEQTKILGDTFELDLGYMSLYASSNPDFIKYVLQTNHKNFRKSMAYDVLKMGLGEGLVTSSGDYWRKQRRLSQPVFYKKNLDNLFQDMGRSTVEFLDYLESKKGETIDISKEMMKITATIVLRSLFTVEESKVLDDIYNSMDTMQTHIMKHIQSPITRFWLYLNGEYRAFKKDMKVMDELIYGMIENRRQSEDKKPDLLQMLMDVEDADTGEKMTDLQLRDELITLFSAGHETSANALAWTIYSLSKNPEVVQKLKTEINTILPNQEMPTFEQLRELKYTEQVINEGMRLFPPAWVVGRRAIEDDVVNGYPIKKGVNLLLEIMIMHRSPNLWENPEAFMPERFEADKMKNYHKNQFMPFGAGPRMCIGNHFAMMEMQLILATMVQRFDFVLDETHKIELEPLITLRSKNGIRVKIKA